MFGPWIEAFTWLKSLKPSLRIKRPSFNFITLHYIYMILLTIVCSVILYGIRNMAYIDALFFAAGAATQSGLNTINVNDLYLYQQIAMYMICMIANPIFINTFLVFVRLYWFEKRFQSVVLESQRLRRTRTRGSVRSLTQGKRDFDDENGDPKLQEAGMAGKHILVMRPGPETMREAEEAEKLANEDEDPRGDRSRRGTEDENAIDNDKNSDTEESGSGDPGQSSSDASEQATVPFRRDITFADEVRHPKHVRTFSSDTPAPPQISRERNIAFLERQRNEADKQVLFIPGPRDFDRGEVPHDVDLDNNSPITPRTRHHHPRMWRKDPDNASNASEHKRIAKTSTFDTAISGARSTIGRRFQRTKTDATAEEDDDPMKTQGLRRRGRRSSIATFVTGRDSADGPLPYLSYQPTIGRNSTFINLTEEQREELGGIEYRSLKTLAVILCTYFVGFHILGVIVLVPWYLRSHWIYLAAEDGFNGTWWGIFTAASAFNDLGFTLTPDSMISFQFAVLPLLFMSFLIIIGNTGFPCMLRFVIWVMSLFVPKDTSLYEELRFLLDHPRRCFTLLFPARATWWLFWVLVILNVTDLVFFIILDLHDSAITALPAGIRVLNGWFQAASTRTAGFADVNLAQLHPAIQVSYLVMMYISVLPIAISVRRTNVYEEKSLGIYAGENEDENEDPNNQSYVGAHLRRQLSFDLWYVFLGLFIIAIVEGTRLQSGDIAFTLFSVLFEIVSAYGTVGLSLGYPTNDASLSAEFHTISKLVIIAMMLRGRHRGLPYALDKAILLPNEGLQRKEEEEAQRRAKRRSSFPASVTGSVDGSVRAPTWRTTTNTSGSARDAYAHDRHGSVEDAEQQDREDAEKAPEEDAALRNGAGPAAPGLRWLQAEASEKNKAGEPTAKSKVTGGLGRLLSQMMSAGPTVKKMMYDS